LIFLPYILPNLLNGVQTIICGAGFNREKAESAARVAWITDPVHPSGHTFAKKVFNLLEAMAPSGKTSLVSDIPAGDGQNYNPF
jgi:hypothetical protein